MLQPATLRFLKELKKNNTKEWFDANRKRYETARQDFEKLLQSVIGLHGGRDEDIASLKPRDCLFRINRDIRFSKDKSPYKTNFGASINRGGRKSVFAGYYIHCEPGESFVGGGLWMPSPDALRTVRQEIDYCFDEFTAIVRNRKFRSVYGQLYAGEDMTLTRPPKGYDENNPAIAFLKMKSFIAMHKLDDKDLTGKDLNRRISDAFEALRPLVKFINRTFET